MQNHKLRNPEIQPWKNKAILETAYCSGKSTTVLAKQWGCSTATIRNSLIHFNIPIRHRGKCENHRYGYNSLSIGNDDNVLTDLCQDINGDSNSVIIEYNPNFPSNIKLEDGIYAKISGEYSLEMMFSEVGNGAKYIFAIWWPRHLIKGNYSEYVKEPKSFKNNLDILRPIYFVRQGRVAVYSISIYTEVFNIIRSKGMEETENGWRINENAEFAVYRMVSESENKQI